MNKPERKMLRLQAHDYTSHGYYFITICSPHRQRRFAHIPVGASCARPHLSRVGECIDEEIRRLSGIYAGVRVDKYVIMPNHVHMIIVIEAAGGGRPQVAPTVSRIIQQFKGAVTKRVGAAIWQRSFYDRVIRDENEYLAIWAYIENNPKRWMLDEYYDGEY